MGLSAENQQPIFTGMEDKANMFRKHSSQKTVYNSLLNKKSTATTQIQAPFPLKALAHGVLLGKLPDHHKILTNIISKSWEVCSTNQKEGKIHRSHSLLDLLETSTLWEMPLFPKPSVESSLKGNFNSCLTTIWKANTM